MGCVGQPKLERPSSLMVGTDAGSRKPREEGVKCRGAALMLFGCACADGVRRAAANQGRSSSLRVGTAKAQHIPGFQTQQQQQQQPWQQGLVLGVDATVPEGTEGGEEEPEDQLGPHVRAALQGERKRVKRKVCAIQKAACIKEGFPNSKLARASPMGPQT
eukprot:1157267-Pelagomonas_calceolata.AAC.5